MDKKEHFLIPLDYEGEWKPVRVASGDLKAAATHSALMYGHLGFRLVETFNGAEQSSKSYLFAKNLLPSHDDRVFFETQGGRNWLDQETTKRYGLITRDGTILKPV